VRAPSDKCSVRVERFVTVNDAFTRQPAPVDRPRASVDGDAATSPEVAEPTSTSPAPCSVTGSVGNCCADPTSSPLSALAPSDGRACASKAAAPATVAAAALVPFTVTKRGEPSAFAPGLRRREPDARSDDVWLHAPVEGETRG